MIGDNQVVFSDYTHGFSYNFFCAQILLLLMKMLDHSQSKPETGHSIYKKNKAKQIQMKHTVNPKPSTHVLENGFGKYAFRIIKVENLQHDHV